MTLPAKSTLALFWCRGCGIVWTSDEAPLCRHGVIDPPNPPERMEPLPSWHPYAKDER